MNQATMDALVQVRLGSGQHSVLLSRCVPGYVEGRESVYMWSIGDKVRAQLPSWTPVVGHTQSSLACGPMEGCSARKWHGAVLLRVSRV